MADFIVKVDDDADTMQVRVYLAGIDGEPPMAAQGGTERTFNYDTKAERSNARVRATRYARDLAARFGCEWATNW